MIAGMQRAALGAVFLATLTPGCSKATPAPSVAPRFNLRVMVLDCYTRSDSRVSIYGQPLALTPPERREDSIGLCYDEPLALGAEIRIDIQSRGQTQHLVVRPDNQARYLLINPDSAPHVELARDAPLLD